MYKDREKGTILRSLLSVILIIAIFCLLVFLGYKLFNKNQGNTKNQTFINNIESMKDAAKSYFTTDMLPSKVGDSKTLTLDEMLEEKLLIEFADENGKSCDNDKSYVKVTKNSNDKYSLKVKLVCGKTTDYIIDTIGCNSTCGQSECPECNCDDTCKDVTEYEYKKMVDKTSTLYSCPDGYKRDGKFCKKTKTVEETPAKKTVVSSGVEFIPAKLTSGAISIIYDDVITSGGTTVYKCPTGYSLNPSDNKCYRYVEGTISYQDEWTCPTGYTRDGTSCYKETEPTKTTTDGKCTCPSGYDLNSAKTKCVKIVNAKKTTKYTSWGNPVDSYTKTIAKTSTCPTYAAGTLTKTVLTGNTVVGNYRKCSYSKYTRTSYTSYSCSSGSIYNTSKCKITKNPSCSDDTVKYTCSVGTLTSNNKCRQTTGATYTRVPVITCPANYTKLSNGQCYITTNPTSTVEPITYKCNDGFDLKYDNGYKCVKEVKTPGTYYCENAGAELDGSICKRYYEELSDKYVCPCGYEAKGTGTNTKCYKATTEKINATATKKTYTTTEYTWSTSKTLSGWTATGKTKTTNTCAK